MVALTASPKGTIDQIWQCPAFRHVVMTKKCASGSLDWYLERFTLLLLQTQLLKELIALNASNVVLALTTGAQRSCDSYHHYSRLASFLFSFSLAL